MDKAEEKIVLDRYNKRLAEFGYSPKTVGWFKSRHKLRYHILLSHWELEGKEILDFGCGFGDMYGYIKDHNIKVSYSGLDINDKLIAEGKKIYPEANLFVKSPLLEGLDKKHDYIFSSGLHNLRLKDNWDFIKKTFDTFNRYSRLGFAANFISDNVDYSESDLFHANPSMVLDLAYKYSRRVVLRNDYMPFEFTVFIDKNESFGEEKVVYKGFEHLI